MSETTRESRARRELAERNGPRVVSRLRRACRVGRLTVVFHDHGRFTESEATRREGRSTAGNKRSFFAKTAGSLAAGILLHTTTTGTLWASRQRRHTLGSGARLEMGRQHLPVAAFYAKRLACRSLREHGPRRRPLLRARTTLLARRGRSAAAAQGAPRAPTAKPPAPPLIGPTASTR